MTKKRRLVYDRIAGHIMGTLAAASLLLVVAMAIGLLLKSLPILQEHSLWDLLTEGEWRPMANKFGFFPFLMGTLYVSLLALAIAIPISLLMAIYLTEYAHSSVKRYVFPLLDILAGFPSVIYGVWGMLVIVPWVADIVAPWLHRHSSGYTVLATGIVLGVTVIPLLVSLFIEIFSNVSVEYREAAWSLGATRWQTTRKVVLRQTPPGIIASTVLATSRAMGETIAVRKGVATFTFKVLQLTDHRLGAKLVPDYAENLTPESELDKLRAPVETFFLTRDRGTGRPTKKDRREIEQIWDAIDFTSFPEDDDE